MDRNSIVRGEGEGEIQADTMVAISLYRGNLHHVVSSAPRQWKMPPRTITPKLFQFLRSKRYKTRLSLLPPQQCSPPLTKPTENTTTKTPGLDNPPDPELEKKILEEHGEDEGDCHGGGDIATIQANDSDKMEKKRELDTKLQGLIQRKHILVQMLKQILNAEEEMKRRSNIQQQSPTVLTRTSLPQPEASPGNNGFDHTPPSSKLNVDVNFANEEDSGYPSSHSVQTHTQTRNQPWTYSSTISPHTTPPLQVTSRPH